MKKFILLLGLSLTMLSCNDAKETAYNEFKASTLLKKYENFKDMSSAIDKKRAEIEMYQTEIESYGVPKDKDERFYLEQRKSELIGIISIHNSLCSDYNSAMSKFNYRFTNVGDLPEGASDPLPREVKPYINKLNK